MNTEEKAKAYDEALENMRKFCNALNNHEETDLWVSRKDIVTDIEYYFPELKESEDERIRKMLIKFFGKGAENNSSTNGISDKDIVAWLEKQEMSYTKKDLDDAYLKGIGDTKNELEKQCGVTSKELSLNSFKDWNWNAMVQQNGKIIYGDADNPVDACYEMIHKLYEQKLL